MSVNAILAIDNNMGIGYENGLPWPTNKKDMKWFSENTRGHVVLMGRKTWESLGCAPLPNRKNVVITKSEIVGEPDDVFAGTIESVLKRTKEKYPHLHIWVIGGANIYRQALPLCDKLYVTRIKDIYKCDTFMYNEDFEYFKNLEYIDEDENLSIQIRSK